MNSGLRSIYCVPIAQPTPQPSPTAAAGEVAQAAARGGSSAQMGAQGTPHNEEAETSLSGSHQEHHDKSITSKSCSRGGDGREVLTSLTANPATAAHAQPGDAYWRATKSPACMVHSAALSCKGSCIEC